MGVIHAGVRRVSGAGGPDDGDIGSRGQAVGHEHVDRVVDGGRGRGDEGVRRTGVGEVSGQRRAHRAEVAGDLQGLERQPQCGRALVERLGEATYEAHGRDVLGERIDDEGSPVPRVVEPLSAAGADGLEVRVGGDDLVRVVAEAYEHRRDPRFARGVDPGVVVADIHDEDAVAQRGLGQPVHALDAFLAADDQQLVAVAPARGRERDDVAVLARRIGALVVGGDESEDPAAIALQGARARVRAVPELDHRLAHARPGLRGDESLAAQHIGDRGLRDAGGARDIAAGGRGRHGGQLQR